MIKNLTGQRWTVFAFDVTTGLPKTGDAANITANLRLDGGAANAVDDTNPTEMEDGYYVFDITQAETNADHIIICPQSSTDDIVVIGVPGAVWTTPAKQAATLAAADVTGNLPANVAQWKGATAPDNTGDAFARLGANGAGLTALPWNAAWDAEVQSECTDALNAYDPPTNTEMTARTLASASYATPTNVWTNATRTLTAISDSAGITTLLSRIGAALTFTSGNVHAHIKAKDNLDFGALEKTSLNAATPSVTVSDKTGFSLATAPPTAVQIRTEMDNNSTKLANLDATTSSRLASASYTAPPTAAAIRGEIDSNSTKLDVAIGTRLAAASYTAPANADITSIKGVTDKLDDTLEDNNDTYRFTEEALAEAPTGGSAPTVSEIWSHETRTLTSFGSLVSDVWSNATRTLTSISDSIGVTTLLTRISATLGFTSGNVNVHVKGKDNLDFGALEKTSLNAATPAVTVSDKTGFALTSDYDAAKSAASQTSVNGIPSAILVTPAQKLVTNVDGSVNAQASVDTEDIADAVVEALEDAGLPTVPLIVAGIMDEPKGDHTGVLAGVAQDLTVAKDATVAKDLTVAKDATVAKAATALSNAVWTDAKAGYVDTAITSRLATANYEAPDNAGIEDIKEITDKLDTMLQADGSDYKFTEEALEEAPVASDAPTVTQIRQELDSNSTKLLNLDATISSRLASDDYEVPPTAVQIRSEIDTNSTKLDVAISTRLASDDYEAPDNESIADIKEIADILDSLIEDSDGNRFTAKALEQAPVTDLTVTDIVNGVLDEALLSHQQPGSVGAGISAAGSAGDPWATMLPGAYPEGTAGYVMGTNLLNPGTGNNIWLYRLVDEETTEPIIGALVVASTDIAGNIIIATAVTDTRGIVRFNLNSGTYYLWRRHVNYEFTDPDIEVLP